VGSAADWEWGSQAAGAEEELRSRRIDAGSRGCFPLDVLVPGAAGRTELSRSFEKQIPHFARNDKEVI